MVEKGKFKNGVPYIRFGDGKQSLLVFSGGPGNYLSSLMSKTVQFLSQTLHHLHDVTKKLPA